MQWKQYDHPFQRAVSEILKKAFQLTGSINLNTEDTTNKSFILHCNIDSYHLCRVRTLIKDLNLNYFADFSKSILN